jgi:myosin-1
VVHLTYVLPVISKERYVDFLLQKPKPRSVPKPKPVAQPLPGRNSTTVASKPAIKPSLAPTSTAGQRPPPAPPRNVALPPARPEPPTYRAKFAFEGQEGEMCLKKDDIVELVEKDENGWWLVKMDGVEGWAPNNYLELVPPKVVSAPPPPPRSRPAPAPTPKISLTPVVADASSKPVSVFPGCNLPMDRPLRGRSLQLWTLLRPAPVRAPL